MYIRFVFALLLFASSNSAPTISLTYDNGRSFDYVVLYNDLSTFPGMFHSDCEVIWDIVPDLPAGLKWSPGPSIVLIVGKPTEISPETKYTVTASTTNGTASLIFTMEVATCDSDKLYFFSTEDEVTLSYQGRNISVYTRKWECLEPVIYDFYIPYIESYQTFSISNRSKTIFLSVTSDSNPKTGQLDMSKVVCSWRILRETRNRQFFDPLGRNVNWVQYLARVTSHPMCSQLPSILTLSKK